MISLLLKRFIHGLIVLWAVATLTFTLLRLAPGGPFDSERKLPPEILANLEAKYHLNEPLIEQYLRYLAGIARGNLGPSYKYLDRGVTEIIADTLPTSALLGGLAIVFALGISFPIGLFAAYYRDSLIDRFCLFVATLGISLPNFILGALLIWAVALQLGWLQAGRWDNWSSAILPTITLGAAPAAYLAALLRSTLVETFGEDFVRTARAKGLKESAVIASTRLQFVDSGSDRNGAADRYPAHRLVRRRIRIRDPRHGTIFYHRRHRPRLSADHGRHAGLHGDLGRRQFYRRCFVWLHRSTDPKRIADGK